MTTLTITLGCLLAASMVWNLIQLLRNRRLTALAFWLRADLTEAESLNATLFKDCHRLRVQVKDLTDDYLDMRELYNQTADELTKLKESKNDDK